MVQVPSEPEPAPVPQLPASVRPLFDVPLRDPSICLAPDGFYYLTGTTGYPTWWHTNDGIRVWRSFDLQTWEPLGLVWEIDRHGTWHTERDPQGNLALWAPEIHYLKGTFWLTYSLSWRYPGRPKGRSGLLRSASGRAEGPYVDAIGGPLTGDIDASLFRDDDGSVYWISQNGMLARLSDDLTALAEEPRLLQPANAAHVGFEGAFLAKIDGLYHLLCAEFATPDGVPLEWGVDGIDESANYHCFVASSTRLRGPYGPRYLAIPHGGHNMLFRDKAGQWWSTLFGNSAAAPIRERPALVRITVDSQQRIRPLSYLDTAGAHSVER